MTVRHEIVESPSETGARSREAGQHPAWEFRRGCAPFVLLGRDVTPSWYQALNDARLVRTSMKGEFMPPIEDQPNIMASVLDRLVDEILGSARHF